MRTDTRTRRHDDATSGVRRLRREINGNETRPIGATQMSKQGRNLGTLGLAVLLAACGGSSAKGSDDAANTVALAAGDVATAVRQAIGEGVVVTGTLAPYHVVEIRAQVPGVLTALRVNRGSRVDAGEVMALIQAEGVRSQAIGAKAAVAAAQAGLALATRQLESSKKLYGAGALSDYDLQAAQAGYEAAQAQLAAARAGEAATGEAAQRASVTAPFAGDISERKVDEGEAVSVGNVLLTLVDPSYLELEGNVPVEDAVRVRAGMPVEFTLDAYPGRIFRGSVARVEPTADAATRQVGVYVRLPNRDRAILGGLYASGRILTGTARDGVVVPIAALRGAGQDAYVWAIRDGKAVKQPVKLGARDERLGAVEVLSGIAAGETVVAAPGDLQDGVSVRIAAAGGVSAAEGGAPAGAPPASKAAPPRGR